MVHILNHNLPKEKASRIAKKQVELEKIEADIASLERKWIAEQICKVGITIFNLY